MYPGRNHHKKRTNSPSEWLFCRFRGTADGSRSFRLDPDPGKSPQNRASSLSSAKERRRLRIEMSMLIQPLRLSFGKSKCQKVNETISLSNKHLVAALFLGPEEGITNSPQNGNPTGTVIRIENDAQ